MTEPEAEFLEIFRDEANGRLDRIVEALLAIESGAGGPEAVDGLFRDIHTIKGAAGMVGLDEIRQLAHVMEDVLADARAEGALAAELVDPLLRSADALRRHVSGDGEPTAELVAELGAARAAGTVVDAPVGVAAEAPEAPNAVAPEAPNAVAPAPSSPAPERSIRVPAEKIDTLLDLVGETVLHRQRLEYELGEQPGDQAHRLVSDELDVGEQLLNQLKDAAIGMRTLPLSSIVAPLPRAVRDLAVETGKDVELHVDGAETELDRAILEALPELLVHLLRNSVAHGIESPEERERVGKAARGRLELRAEQRGGIVEVTVSDDGRGVSHATLAEARRAGSLADVLTQPGYSTAGEVDGISGRGVGLDAVKERVEAFGGSLDVLSEPGVGTEVVLRVPLALALIDVLLVERAGTVYGIPLSSVEEAVSLGETLSLAGRPALEVRGSSVPLADLGAVMGVASEPPAIGSPVVVVSAAGRRLAAVCDALIGKEEIVVKSLGPLLAGVTAYLGAAILGDGRIALLVDPVELVRASTERRGDGQPVAAETSTPKVLVVEDSLTIRELQRSILEAAGYRVQTARDGKDALTYLGRGEEIDLVVTDMEMPEMGGIELTQTIRADPERSTLPIVIVTSLGDDGDRRRGIEAGADAYMVKRTFDQHDLLETVERLVGR